MKPQDESAKEIARLRAFQQQVRGIAPKDTRTREDIAREEAQRRKLQEREQRHEHQERRR